ncbi:MAG: DinB family protein [Sulfitobacter sp.]
MIDTAHVLMMARYNAWQNKQIMDVVKVMDEDDLRADKGAFFGSILATLNHILWGDTIWMSRWCDDIAAPARDFDDWCDFTKTPGNWDAERFAMDGRMRIWAQTLSNLDLTGDLIWTSMMTGEVLRQSKAMCITHMFNHQTHHRGQVHAMLTACGQAAPTTDLVFMPENS